MATKKLEELVESKPKGRPCTPKTKTRAIDWYSEHDTSQDVFDYVRDGYNNVVGVRVDGGTYR